MVQTNADEYLVASYHSLARQLAVALQHEERRCGYVHEQKDKMSAVREDVNTRPEGQWASEVTDRSVGGAEH